MPDIKRKPMSTTQMIREYLNKKQAEQKDLKKNDQLTSQQDEVVMNKEDKAINELTKGQDMIQPSAAAPKQPEEKLEIPQAQNNSNNEPQWEGESFVKQRIKLFEQNSR